MMRLLTLLICLALAADQPLGANGMFGQDFTDYYNRYRSGQLSPDDPFAGAVDVSPLLPFGGPNPFTQNTPPVPESPPPGFSVTPPQLPKDRPFVPPTGPSQEASLGGGLINMASLTGGGGGGLLGGSGGDNMQGDGFMDRLQGGWGPMLMALGGGIAGGATQGWGAGLGQGFQSAAAVAQRNKALAQDQAQFDAKMKLAQDQANRGPDPTDDQREYEAARAQGFQGTFMDYMTAIRQAGAQNISVNTGENAFAKGMGEAAAKRFTTLNDAQTASRTKLKTLDIMDAVSDDPNMYQGSGGESVAQMKNLGKTVFGMDIKGTDSSTVFQSMSNSLALKARSTAGGEGMPGAMSDADRKFLTETVPGISKPKEGNKLLIEVSRRLERRSMEEAAEEANFIASNNGSMVGVSEHMKEWSTKQPPMFDDLRDKAASLGGDSGGPKAGTVEDGYEFLGGDPSNPNNWRRK